MEITDIRIRRVNSDSKMKAVVSVTFDDAIVIHDIKVIEGRETPFIAMPSRRMPNGEFRDIAHPINSETRNALEKAIFEKYNETLEELEEDETMGCPLDAEIARLKNEQAEDEEKTYDGAVDDASDLRDPNERATDLEIEKGEPKGCPLDAEIERLKKEQAPGEEKSYEEALDDETDNRDDNERALDNELRG